jgi:hypothetical protein
MLNIDEMRTRQEQRLVPVFNAWTEAKKQLESAIALAEAREREYQEVCADVRKKLESLDVVASMAAEADEVIPAERRIEPAGLLRRSSRPLLPLNLRTRYARLSILQ